MWLRNLLDTFRAIGASDVLDIVVMACLLYFVLLWFKRTKAAFVARGIFIFALLYVVAQQAGMYLTTWLFQGFFAIFLIALVVIFQEEIRSFFERLAVWSLRQRTAHPLQPKQVESIVRVAGLCARERVGALIVVRGRDPLERHLEGGTPLDGEISDALLSSLFDPHSDGHDGAVIVEGNRVSQFAAHLPLSKDFGKLAHLGTRHAAALGLSERTDALCVIVSEERGDVSLAENGVLTRLPSLETLERHLIGFLRERAPAAPGMRWRDALRRNATEKFLAAGIAVALWLVLVQGYAPASATFKVPIEVEQVPAELRVAGVRPPSVQVTLRGLRRDLTLLNPLTLRVHIPLQEVPEGVHRIVVSEDILRVPGALQLATIDPPVVELELRAVPPGGRRPQNFAVPSAGP